MNYLNKTRYLINSETPLCQYLVLNEIISFFLQPWGNERRRVLHCCWCFSYWFSLVLSICDYSDASSWNVLFVCQVVLTSLLLRPWTKLTPLRVRNQRQDNGLFTPWRLLDPGRSRIPRYKQSVDRVLSTHPWETCQQYCNPHVGQEICIFFWQFGTWVGTYHCILNYIFWIFGISVFRNILDFNDNFTIWEHH
jgi:hypothetical protein